jgi:hypothetical protein
MHIREMEGAHPRGLFKSPTLTVPSQVTCIQTSLKASKRFGRDNIFRQTIPNIHHSIRKTMLSKSIFTEGFG